MDSNIDATKYYYSVQIAKEISLDAAVVFIHIGIYVDYAKRHKSKAKYHEGRYWTYCSRQSIHNSLPYISVSNIYKALTTLIEHGYIIRANYNRNRYDRTYWYTLTDKGWSIYNNSSQSIVTEKQCIVSSEQSYLSDTTSIDIAPQPIPIDQTIILHERDDPINNQTVNTKSIHKVLNCLDRRYAQ